MTPAQCRAARALLNWSQEELADKASIAAMTVRMFETGKAKPRPVTARSIREALERGGIRFIGDSGVELW